MLLLRILDFTKLSKRNFRMLKVTSAKKLFFAIK